MRNAIRAIARRFVTLTSPRAAIVRPEPAERREAAFSRVIRARTGQRR